MNFPAQRDLTLRLLKPSSICDDSIKYKVKHANNDKTGERKDPRTTDSPTADQQSEHSSACPKLSTQTQEGKKEERLDTFRRREQKRLGGLTP